MVYTGPSQGCTTCRNRRVKCDETKPTCNKCRKSGKECLGYREERPIRWQDETENVVERFERQRLSDSRHPSRSSRSSPTKEASTEPPLEALEFLTRNYHMIGRGEGPIARFLETIIQEWYPNTGSSALSRSVAALATCAHDLWIGRGPHTSAAQTQLGLAITAISNAIKDPQESLKDETLAAVLLLKITDCIVSWLETNDSSGSHRSGVVGLINHRGSLNFQNETAALLWCYARRSTIFETIKKPGPLNGGYLTDAGQTLNTHDMDLELDNIGVEVAKVYVQLYEERQAQFSSNFPSLLRTAVKIDTNFKIWSGSQPESKRPTLVSQSEQVPMNINSADVYLDTYEVYPSADIACTWTTYRAYRLIVQQIMLICYTHLIEPLPTIVDPTPEVSPFIIAEDFQELVDGVCASVPYYRSINADFGSDEQSMESPEVVAGSSLQREVSHTTASSLDVQNLNRMRNALAMGAWRIAGPLHRVITILSGPDGHLFRPLLRKGQQEWIAGQIQLVMTQHTNAYVNI